MSDSDLLAEWYRDRGKGSNPISRAEETLIVKALRSRFEEQQHPKPLEHCVLCGIKARGAHHERHLIIA